MLHLLRLLERRYPGRAPLIRAALLAASAVLVAAGALAAMARA